MEDQLVSFKTAKLAQDKGFTVICRHFSKDGSVICDVFDDKTFVDGEIAPFVEIPTQSLLQKWLREIHKIDIEVKVKHGELYCAMFTVANKNEVEVVWLTNTNSILTGSRDLTLFQSYELGLEEAILKALTYI